MVLNKLWTKHFIKILIVTFTIGLCNQIQISTLPLYVLEIGGDKAVAGLMMGGFTIVALLFRPLVGNLLDKRGRKIVLVTGAGIFALISLLYNFAPYIWPLVILRYVHGIGFSAYSTSTGTILADVVPASRLMEGMGIYGVATSLAIAVGPALGLFLISHSGFNQLFLVTFGIAVFGLVTAMLINYEQKLKPAEKVDKTVYFEKTAIKPSLVMFFTSLAQCSVTIFLPLYALQRGIDDIGIFFTIYAVVLMISRPIIGRLSDRIGTTKIIIPGMLFLIFSLLATAAASSLSVFIIISFFYGLGLAAAYPVLSALAVKFSPPSRRGSANATFLSAVDAGWGIGSILWGVLAEITGFPVVFAAAAGCVVISVVLFLLTMRKLPNHMSVLDEQSSGTLANNVIC